MESPIWVRPTTNPAFVGAIQAERTKWDTAGIVDYRYDLTLGCFCGTERPVKVVVQDSSGVSITNAAGTPIPVDDVYYDLYAKYATVEQAFDAVTEELQDPDRVVLELTFDDALGFPTHSLSDYLLATDGGLSMAITNFEVLP